MTLFAFQLFPSDALLHLCLSCITLDLYPMAIPHTVNMSVTSVHHVIPTFVE